MLTLSFVTPFRYFFLFNDKRFKQKTKKKKEKKEERKKEKIKWSFLDL